MTRMTHRGAVTILNKPTLLLYPYSPHILTLEICSPAEMMEYLKHRGGKKSNTTVQEPEESQGPLLNEEDEAFLQRIAEEGTPPPLPERKPGLPQRPLDLPVVGEVEANNMQLVLVDDPIEMDDPKEIPLPETPDTPNDAPMAHGSGENLTTEEKEHMKSRKKRAKWSFLRRDSRDSKRRNQKAAATDLMTAAQGLKPADAQPNEDGNVSDQEAAKEEDEMASLLEQLNLAAVDNRVFSMSKESQELLNKFVPFHSLAIARLNILTTGFRFKFVLKDLVNGVPTAYGDLESLLTNSENQMQRSFDHLPSPLQKLVKQLPSKMTQSVGPEVLAAAAEKQGLHSKYTDQAAHAAEKMGLKVRVPTLKDLVTKPGAVAGMLKAIMNFLKLRFPAFLGMNVLYSLSLFGMSFR